MVKRKSNKKPRIVNTKTLVENRIELAPYLLLLICIPIISLIGTLWLMVFSFLIIKIGRYG